MLSYAFARRAPANHENPLSPRFSKGGLGGFGAYFLHEYCCITIHKNKTRQQDDMMAQMTGKVLALDFIGKP
jgi:hypothetical protein